MQKSIPQDNIKDQYSKGPQTQKEEQLTPEQLKQRREEQDKKLDEILPFLKKQEEYDRLQMSLTEMDVLMGRVSISQVPGLLGLELRVREVQAQGFLMQWAEGQKRAMEEHAKTQAVLHKDISDAIFYSNAQDAGKVQAFMKNEVYDEKLHTLYTKDPNGILKYQVPQGNTFREITVEPGKWLISDSQGQQWCISAEEYRAAMEYKARAEFDKLSPEDQAKVQQEAVEAYQKAQKQTEANIAD